MCMHFPGLINIISVTELKLTELPSVLLAHCTISIIVAEITRGSARDLLQSHDLY